MYFWWYPDWYNGAAYRAETRQVNAGGRDHDRAGSGGERPAPSRDQQLTWAVADALVDDPTVTGGRIDLSVQNGVVILDGEADTEDTQCAAVARAWSVPGVRDVCNALTVVQRQSRRRR